MKTIKFNNKALRVSAPYERALRTIKDHSFAAPLDAFVEGPPLGRFILPHPVDWKTFGIKKETNGVTKKKRAVKFFANHPRRRFVILGNARRINAILAKLDAIKKD
jgi:hypothetical protein